MADSKVAALPKPTSSQFKAMVQLLRDNMDLPTLVVIFEGALDRMGLELVIKKMMRGRGGKTKKTPKNILIAQAAKAFYASNDSAHVAMKLLDKRCAQERQMVASVSEKEIPSKVNSMEALIFPNERARMVWALFRDERQEHVLVAKQLVKDTLDKLQYESESQEKISEPGQAKQLLSQMKDTEKRLLRKKEDVEDLGKRISELESERASLMVKLGQKENQYKSLQAKYQDLLRETKTLRRQDEVSSSAQQEIAQSKNDALRTENEELKTKLDSLQRKVEFSKTGPSEVGALEEMNKLLREEKRHRNQLEKERDRLQEQLAHEMHLAKERTTDLRASLKRARKIAVDVKKARDEKETRDGPQRCGFFVDAANLSASALRQHGGMFDFVALLKDLTQEHKTVKATAYVVKQKDADEKQTQSYEGFAKALRHEGYDIKQKVPRQRKDGSIKADWDLGIAMDIVASQQKFDKIILASGDGDFLPLVKYLQKRQKKVVIAAFKHSASEPLLAAADEVLLLDDAYQVAV